MLNIENYIPESYQTVEYENFKMVFSAIESKILIAKKASDILCF